MLIQNKLIIGPFLLGKSDLRNTPNKLLDEKVKKHEAR